MQCVCVCVCMYVCMCFACACVYLGFLCSKFICLGLLVPTACSIFHVVLFFLILVGCRTCLLLQVILLEPFFDIYPAQVTMAGGICKYVPMRARGPEDGEKGTWVSFRLSSCIAS